VVPRIPEGFVAYVAYAPPDHGPDEPWIVQLLDARAHAVGRAVGIGTGMLVLVGLLLSWRAAALAVAVVGFLIALVFRLFVGRSGFYALYEDGTVGERLGRVQPDVTGRRRVAIRRRRTTSPD
jgi:hypothetical protein